MPWIPLVVACCRARIGQPLSMYPPGRLLFLRPIKTRQHKEFDAVWITPQDLVGEKPAAGSVDTRTPGSFME